MPSKMTVTANPFLWWRSSY